MSTVFKKLNLKDHKEILVLNSPESFEPELALLEGVAVKRSLEDIQHVEFSLAFVTQQNELDTLAKAIVEKVEGDALVWFAYPKASSKKYTCEFNRDTGWAVLGEAGFEPVRQVAIDQDWSALRFRRVAFIKKMVRDRHMALSKEGKKRLSKD